MKRLLLIGIMLAFALLAMPFVSAAFPCAFVNSTQTIQSDDFNRADNPTGCDSTLKGTPYINNVKGSVENNTYIVDGGAGDPCEIPKITVTGGNLSYQFNISMFNNPVEGNSREISFIDYVGVLDQFIWGQTGAKMCWSYLAVYYCTANFGTPNDWYTFRFNFDATNSVFTGYWYNNSVLIETFGNQLDQFNIGGFGGRNWLNGDYKIDDFMMWNSTALGGDACPTAGGAGETNPPIISNINCTSCVTDPTPDAAPYTTDDTTPTFNFTTDEAAWCAIGATDINYTVMGSTRNCTTGEGSNGHICTLTPQDKFTSVGANNVYISCKDSSNNEGNISDHSKSNSGALWMEITGQSESGGDAAIQAGIEASEIWSSNPTVYSNHQVYARNLSNAQFTGAFDRVAVLGTKRWALNYVSDGESAITGLFNITPVLYVLQLQNKTNETIINEVSAFINGTYP